MTETRKNKEGTLVASFHKNATSLRPPAHRYSVTLTKRGRLKETTINRHAKNVTEARAVARQWIIEGKL